MTKAIIRILQIVLIIAVPFIFDMGCKKQPKCGCSGDMLFTLDSSLVTRSSLSFSSDGASAYLYSGYDVYYFCNANEYFEQYSKLSSEDQIFLSGEVYWNCNYVMNSSSSYSYYNYYKYYDVRITAMVPNNYGKK
jgi:hypothetical protein